MSTNMDLRLRVVLTGAIENQMLRGQFLQQFRNILCPCWRRRSVAKPRQRQLVTRLPPKNRRVVFVRDASVLIYVVEMVGDEALERVHDRGGVVEVLPDARRGDVCTLSGKVDSMPLDKLVFATMVPVVL